ncbi:hypothetical protein DPX39_030011300 [Trypanosoma brucei equiperdum]|uniref:Uncharacterized protein n=1 Tax=Trypanosoma brucei equiperdum TaxID=630700 RepID=A0A3L6LDB7_9TRYP|nr:hypothetical protein DPX39_030011300 [Trypanosoma brucei equiperdum]
MPSYRTETAVIPPKTPRVKGACHDNDVKEVEPPTATQQLQKVRQMFRRLDSHNDGMEEALIGLRSRIDTFRSLLATCLNGTVKELRGELRILRESTQFLVQDFAGDLEQCRRIIMRRLQGEANRRGYDPPPTRSFKKDYSMEGGLSKRESSWELQQQCGAGRGEQSVFPGWRELEVREDLLEAQQRCTALEKKLKQQREAHENHLSAMKDMYESKEYTLKRRVELLERLVERDSEKLRYILSDDSKGGHGKWGKRGHFKEEQDNYYSSGDDDCDEVRESSRLHTRSKQSLKAPAQKLLKKRRGGLVKEHESHQSQHPRQGHRIRGHRCFTMTWSAEFVRSFCMVDKTHPIAPKEGEAAVTSEVLKRVGNAETVWRSAGWKMWRGVFSMRWVKQRQNRSGLKLVMRRTTGVWAHGALQTMCQRWRVVCGLKMYCKRGRRVNFEGRQKWMRFAGEVNHCGM